MDQYPHSDITEKIISAAYEVYNKLGPGFLENVYENCMVIALKKRGLKIVRQKPYRMLYDGEPAGEFRLDILVEDCVVVEFKAVAGIMPLVFKAQTISYLRLTKLLVGLLINFGNNEIEIHRLQNKYELDKLQGQ